MIIPNCFRDDAVKQFEAAHNHEMLSTCYYQLEDFESLESLVRSLPDNSTLLPSIAEMFTSVGMSQQAVAAYMKVKTWTLCIIQLK